MTIKWYKNSSNLVAKVNRNNIILNSSCTKLLNQYAYCIIGYSESHNNIVISPVDYSVIDNKELDCTPFKISNTRSYSRISCTDFISEISQTYQLDFSNEKKYDVNWDEKKQTFTIDLKSEVNE